MIIDRLKNILRATINDQMQQNPVFKKYFEEANDADVEEILREYQRKFNQQVPPEQEEPKQHHRSRSYTNPETEKERRYYADLEVPYGSSFEEVKKSYRRLVKIYHPDLYQDPEKQKVAQEVTRKINEAYNYFESKKNRQT